MEQPTRKIIRLQNYDYGESGAYFITLCTYNKEKLFGDIWADSISAHMIARVFENTINSFSKISCPKYVVMPNHFHAIVVIERADTRSAPTLMDIVQAFKSKATVEYIRLVKEGLAPPFYKHLWQRSFYDHVIRNDRDYQEIWKYIDENPQKWQLDKFYIAE